MDALMQSNKEYRNLQTPLGNGPSPHTSYSSMDSRFQIKEGRCISKKQNHEISNKHLFNIHKLSTKKNTQNFCFVTHYNVIIY